MNEKEAGIGSYLNDGWRFRFANINSPTKGIVNSSPYILLANIP